MGKTVSLAVAVVVVGGAALAGCEPRGGGDPRDAPGCDLNAYRCDGDVLQICQINAAERRKTWWDVHDCAEFGADIGQAMACVEPGGGAPAECVEVDPDAGVGIHAGDAAAVSGCSQGEYRCNGDILQGCGFDLADRRNEWWDLQDCLEWGREIGTALACVESDAGVGAGCEDVTSDGGGVGDVEE